MTLIQSNTRAEYNLSDMSDLHRLWWAEFGDTYEVVARLVAIVAAATCLWLYNGWVLGLVWALCYIAVLGVAYSALRSADPSRPSAWVIGIGSFITSALIFISLPLYLVTSSDVVLAFCGAFGLIGLGLFTLFRKDTPAIIQPFDIAMGWITVGVVAITYVPGQASWAAQGIMIFLCLVVGGYFTHTLISSRTARVELRQAALRQQDVEKREAVSRISGGFAHDFNNILTVLQGSLELYQVAHDGPERDALVNDARIAGARATGLVSQLLAFSRRAPLEARAHEAGIVIHELASLARRRLPESIQINTRVVTEAVNVLADPDGLQSALLNLLMNAKDAIDGRGVITVAVDLVHGPAIGAGTAPVDDPVGGHLMFSVADDGPGIPPAVLARATEPFFTTKTAGKGSGLGLAIALGFAEQSGGTFHIKTSDSGTIAALHLPIAHGAADSQGQRTEH